MNLLRLQALYVGLFLAAVFAVAIGAEAGQNRGGPPRGPDIEQLAAEPDLDADQQTRLQAIFDGSRSRLMTLRDDVRASGGRPSAETRAEAERIREQTDSQIAQVLDEAQYQRYLELREQHRAARRGGGPRERQRL